MTLAHRAAIIRGADPADPLAGYPLGILALRGDLSDPDLKRDPATRARADEQNDHRHQAGLIYAGLHAIVWNGQPGRPNPSPRSHLAAAIAGICEPLSDIDDDDRASIYRRCSRQLREAVAHVLIEGRRAMRVLDNIVIYDHRMRFMDTANRRPAAAWEADRRDLEALRAALGALTREFKLAPRRMAA